MKLPSCARDAFCFNRHAALLAVSALLAACSRAEEPKAKLAAAEPGAVVAKALGKGHVPKASPWASPAACDAELERTRAARAHDSFPRMATWNVRYLATNARALVSGVCSAAHCVEVFPTPKAEKFLSDHCPLLLDLKNEDVD